MGGIRRHRSVVSEVNNEISVFVSFAIKAKCCKYIILLYVQQR